MGVINLRAIFDWKAVQTGLENMKGQFQRVGAEVDKGFSVGSIARNFIGGFVGVNLAAKIVEPFKMAAEYAKKLSDSVASIREVSLAGIMERNTPERQVKTIDGEMRGNEARLEQIQREMRTLPDFANKSAIQLAQSNPELANPFVLDAVKGQYDALLEEQQALQKTQQELQNKRQALQRQIRDGDRRARAGTAASEDSIGVVRGHITSADALQKAAERALKEYEAVLKNRGAGVESREAYNAYLNSKATAEQARINEDKQRRGLRNDEASIRDQRSVQEGKMSAYEAAAAEARRARAEVDLLYQQGRPEAEVRAAENNALRAENALIPLKAAADRDRINGVLPQISSSSLAQIGGGGNVNVFGGRPGEGLTELSEQTRLLREISTKLPTATGGGTDVGA